MTNSIALGLAVVILGCIAVDTLFFETRNLLFLGKHLAALIEWMAFWR